MKKIASVFLLFSLCVMFYGCAKSHRYCLAIKEKEALFTPHADTVIYYNLSGDSIIFTLSKKEIIPSSTQTWVDNNCDCECGSFYHLYFDCIGESLFKSIFYGLNSGPVKDTATVKQIGGAVGLYTTNDYPLISHSFNYTSDFSHTSMSLTDVELNGIMFSDVTCIKNEAFEIYLAKEYGIVQITDKVNGDVWTISK